MEYIRRRHLFWLQGWENCRDSVYFANGKASFIEIFHNSNKTLNLTFGEAITKLGEPEYIINTPTSGGIPGSPTTSYIVIAIHPEWGFGFGYDTRDQPASQKAEIKPENKLYVIIFFAPEFLDQLLDAGFYSTRKLGSSEIRKSWKPWDGYGSLVEKYPPAKIIYPK